jgi:ABC-type lipoprotein release transport system permease subunit
MTENQKDPIGISLLFFLFILLGVMGFIYYKSIDSNVLKRLEQAPLVLPTQTATATPSSSSAEKQ